jgi:hypothetical protein
MTQGASRTTFAIVYISAVTTGSSASLVGLPSSIFDQWGLLDVLQTYIAVWAEILGFEHEVTLSTGQLVAVALKSMGFGLVLEAGRRLLARALVS